ncbi:MAG: 23S rRNA (adenine(2503)-C(2))-methyltransferase RlmN [Candidatus Wallbacteria bacterium]|nr:23S rRNA (adenine(2503)-C(2))-methyltransferase RlmN [Candidatus Wallbacteria bacterium]
MKSVYDLEFDELCSLICSMGEKKFRAHQVSFWLYQKKIGDFSLMTDLPEQFRLNLSSVLTGHGMKITLTSESPDGTVKFLISLSDGETVETVIIPDKNRLTLCVSSQVGCPVGCAFCATAKIGFIRQLAAHEIIGQYLLAEEFSRTRGLQITNVVLMGMGEALLNYDNVLKALRIFSNPRMLSFSRRRITVSTAGFLPGLSRFADTPFLGSLAISLGGAFQRQREQLIPFGREFTLKKLLNFCHEHRLAPRQRYTFAYVLIAGVNDSDQDAAELAVILKDIPCKINLIPYNETPLVREFHSPEPARVESFGKILLDNHYTVLVRKSRGRDISAACGLLRAGYENKT